MRINVDRISYLRGITECSQMDKEWMEGCIPKKMYERYCERIDRKAERALEQADRLSANLEFKVDFISDYGYIADENIEKAKEVLGAEYPVVAKYYKGPRTTQPLGELDLSDQNLKSVFVRAADYKELKREWEL